MTLPASLFRHTHQKSAKREGRHYINNTIRRKRRTQLLELRPWRCNNCYRWMHAQYLEMDHIVEVADGGCNCLINLQLLCHECHEEKTADARLAREGLA